ncbi:MAG: hypothetical protein AAGA45_01890, partial [Verrucomicrobiota bacterium]
LCLAAGAVVALPARCVPANNGVLQLAVAYQLGNWSSSELKTIERASYTLQYPSSWRLGDGQQDFNIDRNFTIMVASTDSYIEIRLFKPTVVNSQQLMRSLMETLDGTMIDTEERQSFSQWGKINGEGRHLMGEIAGFFEGGARIFVSTENDRGILVTELYYSDDKDEAMPGFELIRSTFQFR